MRASVAIPERAYVPAIKWRASALALELKLRALGLYFKAGYNPDQPRISAGEQGGGQWTGGATVGDGSFRVAQASPRGSGRTSGSGFGSFPDATPAAQARLTVSQSAANAAVSRVQNHDMNWRAPTGVYETIEGAISQNNDVTAAANARYVEILTEKAGPGPYAIRSLPGRGPFTRPTLAERVLMNELGDECGCHTCGSRSSGVASGNWYYDHQTPSALGRSNAGRSALPHCIFCSSRQGGYVKEIIRFK